MQPLQSPQAGTGHILQVPHIQDDLVETLRRLVEDLLRLRGRQSIQAALQHQLAFLSTVDQLNVHNLVSSCHKFQRFERCF